MKRVTPCLLLLAVGCQPPAPSTAPGAGEVAPINRAATAVGLVPSSEALAKDDERIEEGRRLVVTGPIIGQGAEETPESLDAIRDQKPGKGTNPVVTIRWKAYSVDCILSPGDPHVDDLAGDKVKQMTVSGRCDVIAGTSIVLRDCRILSSGP